MPKQEIDRFLFAFRLAHFVEQGMNRFLLTSHKSHGNVNHRRNGLITICFHARQANVEEETQLFFYVFPKAQLRTTEVQYLSFCSATNITIENN